MKEGSVVLLLAGLLIVVLRGVCRLLLAVNRAGESLIHSLRKRWLAAALSRSVKSGAWRRRRGVEIFR